MDVHVTHIRRNDMDAMHVITSEEYTNAFSWYNSCINWGLRVWSFMDICGPPIFPREIHLNNKYWMATWFLVTWWWRFIILQDLEFNSNIIHFLTDSFFPLSGTILPVNILWILNRDRYLNAVLVIGLANARVNSHNNPISLAKCERETPGKFWLILNDVIRHIILFNLNWVRLLQVLQRCPSDCAGFPFDTEFSSHSSLPHRSTSTLFDNPLIFLLYCYTILWVLQDDIY